MAKAADNTASNGSPSQNEETKRQKFVRLVNKRSEKALHAIAQLATLANKSQYDFTEADAGVVRDALYKAVTKVDDAFKASLEGKAAAPVGGLIAE